MPFGEVVVKVGAVAPLHKVNVVTKSGTTLFPMVTKTVSVISSPQLFIAVNVNKIVAVAFVGIVYDVVNDVGLLKLPLGAVHATDCCPSAIPVNTILSPGQAVMEGLLISTKKGCTGAEQP
jgi:hypothetical protein